MTTSEQARADNYMTPGYRTPSAWAASLAVARLHDADALQRDRQDRLDAMADAAQLQLIAKSVIRGFAYQQSDTYKAGTAADIGDNGWRSEIAAQLAAAYAFRAIPGLRGEDKSEYGK